MDKQKLDNANEIIKKIQYYESVLYCFEWTKECGGHSRNPQLIIEFDSCDGYRDQVPMILNEYLTSIIKNTIKSELDKLNNEFREL